MSDQLRVLLVGNGGREHAIAWKLLQSPRIDHIFVCPGNGGTATLNKDKVSNISSVKETDFAGLVTFANENKINLLIPGPEAPLVAGIVDHFALHAKDVKAFGPSLAAATMEGSKTFSKTL
jgi:phosphoribosylamine-glycine ligase